MTRFLIALALTLMLGACAAPGTQPGGAEESASASASDDDKRCMRVTQTGSNMAQRRCSRDNR